MTDVCSNQLCMSLCACSIEWQLKHFTGYSDTNSAQTIKNFCSLRLDISFLEFVMPEISFLRHFTYLKLCAICVNAGVCIICLVCMSCKGIN